MLKLLLTKQIEYDRMYAQSQGEVPPKLNPIVGSTRTTGKLD